MKSKHLLSSIGLLILLICFPSCMKEKINIGNPEVIATPQPSTPCDLNDTHYISTLWPVEPDDTLICDAFFESWFISSATGECFEAGYSGCEEMGFPSQASCENCVENLPCYLNEDHFLQTAFPPLDPDSLIIDCTAFFVTWFIDRETGDCIESGYSGCEAKGFQSLEGCERCAEQLTFN